MVRSYGVPGKYGLENHKFANLGNVYWNLPAPALVEQAILRSEGELSPAGALVVSTGRFTGRSPNDKYIVDNFTDSEDRIWWGKINRPISEDNYKNLYHLLTAYFQGRDLFVQDVYVGAHPAYQLPVRIITEQAWHSLFARGLFIRPHAEQLVNYIPQFTVIQAPGFLADPEEDGTNSGTFVILDLRNRVILIGGTSYAGEIKKAVFSMMNYLLPVQGVLPMHCSANTSEHDDVALFFGLSGTGKTTLSSDPERRLIGDDEHGWGDQGVFNFEGGCYAKTIHLCQDLEPQIWSAARNFGTVLENVVMDPITRVMDFNDARYTENTRAAYPIDYVPGHVESGYAGQPKNVFLLTADAFGVMPPLARLTRDQAMYYFLSGYTSKLAGTEKDLGVEPEATFSACFGAPFLPLHPRVYVQLLGEKIARHQTSVWLLNTGWTGGPYGVGRRIHLPYTRAMVRAVLTGHLDKMPTRTDPYFGLFIPVECPDVPTSILDPQSTWTNPQDYDRQARGLIARFDENFKQFVGVVSQEILAVGPSVIG
ncbi:MAG: phosphoenolpyruvate carboxykinase (ATP) [Anaerolineaceae bacterium]|nr:phosphoenolpyruvate carboxykinase (ATP) [Anaerolineaceae bacterium]